MKPEENRSPLIDSIRRILTQPLLLESCTDGERESRSLHDVRCKSIHRGYYPDHAGSAESNFVPLFVSVSGSKKYSEHSESILAHCRGVLCRSSAGLSLRRKGRSRVTSPRKRIFGGVLALLIYHNETLTLHSLTINQGSRAAQPRLFFTFYTASSLCRAREIVLRELSQNAGF